MSEEFSFSGCALKMHSYDQQGAMPLTVCLSKSRTSSHLIYDLMSLWPHFTILNHIEYDLVCFYPSWGSELSRDTRSINIQNKSTSESLVLQTEVYRDVGKMMWLGDSSIDSVNVA